MRMSVIQSVCLSLVILCSSAGSEAGVKKNGFDLTDGLVPTREIRRGGPPRDGIPAIYLPNFVKASEQRDVAAEDTVLLWVEVGQAQLQLHYAVSQNAGCRAQRASSSRT